LHFYRTRIARERYSGGERIRTHFVRQHPVMDSWKVHETQPPAVSHTTGAALSRITLTLKRYR